MGRDFQEKRLIQNFFKVTHCKQLNHIRPGISVVLYNWLSLNGPVKSYVVNSFSTL